VEIGYLGASAKKLPLLGQNINEVRPQDRGPGNGQIRRPYPQFGNVLAHGEAITSTLYYGGLISVKRTFSNGLTFQTNYTLSRFRSAGIFKSYYDRDHAPSNLERRHRFVWSGVYDLPWGPGKKFLNSGLLGNVAGGWTLGAIVTLQSGAPSSLGNIVNTCNCFTSRTQSVNVVGSPVVDHGNFDPSKNTWFNTAAFAAPEPYTYGNAGPGIIRQPGLNIIDTTITKAIRFRERFTTELRGEFYNFFNHTNWGGADLTFGSPTFGRITSAGAPFRPTQRIIQMAAKFYF
jgi:hypothetical protein